MTAENTKRIVVIKNVPSNIVEEAILILKNEPGSELKKKSHESIHKNHRKRDNEYLLKEAEAIINQYIKGNNEQAEIKRELNLRPERSRRKFFSSVAINSALIGSIALLLFLIAKVL